MIADVHQEVKIRGRNFGPPFLQRFAAKSTSYTGIVTVVRSLTLLFLLACMLPAAELKPETAAAFDRYIKLTEEGFAQHQGANDFLWLDQHSKEKTMIWLQQSVVMPMQTLDHGAPIEVPGGVIQHWFGAVYAEGMDVGNVSRMMLNFPLYKEFFKQDVLDSKLIKQNGNQYDLLLRLYKKQLSTIVLNVNETAKYTVINPTRWTLDFHSTHIGEAAHPKDKKKLDDERAPEDTEGYLWRLNMYVRVQQADNGVYIELEVISLAREPEGKLHPSHFLSGFQNFPHELTQTMVGTFETIFPHPKRG